MRQAPAAVSPAVVLEDDWIFINDGYPLDIGWHERTAIGLALGMDREGLRRRDCRGGRKAGGLPPPGGWPVATFALLDLDAKTDQDQANRWLCALQLSAPLTLEETGPSCAPEARGQFSRVFRVETGKSPAKSVENMRPRGGARQ
jgi:hypothetical protein